MAAALQGRRIVVTRAPGQAAALLARLRAAGAEAISLPTIRVAPPADLAPLDQALGAVDTFQGFIFTSANAVGAFFERGRRLAAAPRRPSGSWIAAVGPATARALAAHPGWSPDLVPGQAGAEGVLQALEPVPVRDQRILFPRAAEGRDLIPEVLARRGAHLTLVAAYRTVPAAESQATARSLFPTEAPARADTTIFTSGSTARNLATLLGADYRQRLRGVALAAIGPATRQTLENLGLTVAAEAPSASPAGLVRTLIEYWHARTA